jgi:hypothetical protein
VWSLFLQQKVHENISSQNSVLLHNLCHKFVNHSCHTVENIALLLHFVLMTQTCQFTEQVKPMIFLEISPICHQFCPVFSGLVHVFYMFSYCLEWNMLLETFFHNYELLLFWKKYIKKPMLEFIMTLFAGMWSSNEISIGAANNSHRTCNVSNQQHGCEPVSGFGV